LEGNAGGGAVLDHHHHAGAVWTVNLENTLMKNITNRRMFALGETHVRVCGPNVMATPNADMRFWIITIMLVLFGLSTLKIR
ncbi:MAG: hypothetical protein AAB319_00075, partial [Pseudomonadota bacterium]